MLHKGPVELESILFKQADVVVRGSGTVWNGRLIRQSLVERPIVVDVLVDPMLAGFFWAWIDRFITK